MAKKTVKTAKSIFSPISTFVINNKPITIIALVGLIVFGLLSYTTFLRREGFPPVAVPISVGAGQYFVDDATQVDVDVAQPINDLISGLDGVESVQTNSRPNTFSFAAGLDDTLTSDEANTLIAETINDAGILPSGAEFMMIQIDAAKLLGDYDIIVSVFSRTDQSTADLEAAATDLASRLTSLDLVERAELESQFITNPLDPTDQFKSTFGRAYDAQDGVFRESATIGVTGQVGDDFDLFKLDDAVSAELDAYSTSQADFTSVATNDLSTSVSQDIDSLQSNVIFGALIVTIVSAILISWRVSILTAFFIVAVLLVSVAVLYAVGLTLNTITLFSLVLALGLFVDDATIIAESIYAKRDPKKKPVTVVKEAIDSIGSASFSGTITTVLVFSPLLFITGILGDFIFQMPLTVIISLLVSFFLSITLIPLLANYTILGEKQAATNRTAFLSDFLVGKLQLLKTRPMIGKLYGWGMIMFSLALIFIGGIFFGRLGFDIFPSGKDGNQAVVNINFDQGTDLATAEAITDDITDDIESVFGDYLVRAHAINESQANENLAPILIEITPFTERSITSVELIERLEDQIGEIDGADVTASASAGGPPSVEFPFLAQVSVQDGDINQSIAAGQAIIDFLGTHEEVVQSDETVRLEKSELGFTESVVRLDGDQFIEVRAGFNVDATTGTVDELIAAVESEFDDSRMSAFGLAASDISFDLGQESDFAESFNALPFVSLAVLGIMYVLLFMQFGSFAPTKKQGFVAKALSFRPALLVPSLILLALPFSFFGVGVGLFVTDNPLSFFVMIGLIGLIGIAVNNTILLTDNAKHHQAQGKDPVDAISNALHERFRPLLTTTVTTLAALLPLALFNPFWEALAFTIIFGLFSSTILVVLAFPYYYLACEYLRRRYGYWGILIVIASIALLMAGSQIGLPLVGIVPILLLLDAYVFRRTEA